MSDQPSAEQARAHYEKGLVLKKAGDNDAALTEFRRAVLADTKLQPAFFEIGSICRQKSNLDPVYLRHAFDALKQAVRLDVNHQDAHDQYLIVCQKMKRLDEAMDEYEAMSKTYPDNEVIKRAQKNIFTISMAMMPEKVNVASSSASPGARKAVLFSSIGVGLFGLVLIFAAPFISKKKEIPAEEAQRTMKQLIVVGSIMAVASVGGLIVFTRLK